MRLPLFFCSPVLAAALAVLAGGAASANVLINVDKHTQQMTVSVNGSPLYHWPVSTGLARYDTPSGNYTTFRMEAEHFSKEWDDAPMPHSIFFTKMGHAIHGSFDVKRLGRPASHGCVRISPANATKLFALVKQEGLGNTKVVLSGQLPAPGPAMARRAPAELANTGGNIAAPLPLTPQAMPSYGSNVIPRDDYGRPAGQYQQPQYDRPRYAQPQYQQQPQYGQPRYAEPLYNQPRYAGPQYQQPRYEYARPQYRDPRYQQPRADDAQPSYGYAAPRGYYQPRSDDDDQLD